MAERTGTGIFPREPMKRLPLLPLEEEGRLNDMPLRENLIERIFAYYRWTEILKTDPTPGGLVRFHTAHKLTLMAHSPKHYTEMGPLLAKAGTIPGDELSATYGRLFMEGLALLGTRRKHVNVLQHLMGYLKKGLSSEDKQELLGLIKNYRATGAADRAADAPEAPPAAASGAGVGVAAGVPQPLSQGADAAESCVGASEEF